MSDDASNRQPIGTRQKRHLIPGVQTRGPRPDAAGNARSSKVRHILHDRKRNLLTDQLDKRTAVARAYKLRLADLRAHVGEESITVPIERVLDQAVRLGILCDLAWREVHVKGPLGADGNLSGPAEAFLRAAKNEREVLTLIGLERRQRPVPDLADYLAAKAEERGDG